MPDIGKKKQGTETCCTLLLRSCHIAVCRFYLFEFSPTAAKAAAAAAAMDTASADTASAAGTAAATAVMIVGTGNVSGGDKTVLK